MAITHWIYPLSSTSQYYFDDVRAGGGALAITPENYWSFAMRGTTDRWGLHGGFRVMEAGDLVWAYFAAPTMQIVGVGTALQVEWDPGFGRHAVDIRWNATLTKRLRVNPIHYSEYRQQVQYGSVRANTATKIVLDRWLAGSGTSLHKSNAEQVLFATREVLHRLGQRDFRNATLAAYNSTCAITGCSEPAVLQAAHIVPVTASGRHEVANSLLLRADIHNLFDLGKLYVGPDLTVAVDASVTDPSYAALTGSVVSRPTGVTKAAFANHLALHRVMHNR